MTDARPERRLAWALKKAEAGRLCQGHWIKTDEDGNDLQCLFSLPMTRKEAQTYNYMPLKPGHPKDLLEWAARTGRPNLERALAAIRDAALTVIPSKPRHRETPLQGLVRGFDKLKPESASDTAIAIIRQARQALERQGETVGA